MYTIRQIFESLRFAGKALKSNLLRTILSLLGVTIGIFAIISVLTLVDSLEKNIKDSLNFLPTLLLALALVLAWRFLLGIAALALSILLWVLLFTFCKGIAQGFRETTENGGAA